MDEIQDTATKSKAKVFIYRDTEGHYYYSRTHSNNPQYGEASDEDVAFEIAQKLNAKNHPS